MNKELNYSTIHKWLASNLKKEGVCSECGIKKNTHYALINGKYHYKDVNNYIELCPSCHKKYDMTDAQRTNISNGRLSAILRSPETFNIFPVIATKDNRSLHFDSVGTASREMRILKSSISNCLHGRSNTSGGYKWEYRKKELCSG